MLWSSQLIACDGRQLINLIASMYEYPKEILIFGSNINQPLTTANIGEVILSSMLPTMVSSKNVQGEDRDHYSTCWRIS